MAYTYQVPVSYTVNVSLSQNPTGLAGYNTNSIAIFSNEQANFSENYIRALGPDTIKAAYGSDSLTYKMALALYTPAFNFTTGGGNLYVFKYNGVNATFGKVVTQSITSKIETFKTVKDGVLTINIDGTQTVLSNLNFSSIVTVDDIVTVIKNENPDVNISANNGIITFKSKRPGGNVTLQATTGQGTDIAGTQYLNSSSATVTSGTNASGETLSDAVSTALQQVYFGGVLTTQFIDNTALLTNSSAIQAMDCVFYNELESLKNITVAGTANKTAGNSKTRLLAYSMGSEEAKVAVATYATIAKSVNYSGTDTANTLNLKTLTGVVADNGLSDTYVLNAQENGVDIYGNTGGLSVVYSNDNNGYTDDVEAQLRISKDLQVGGWNYLRQTNTKIPQTEQGMTGLKNSYALVCEKFVRNGVVAPGTWNGAYPFGDADAFSRNIEEKGYYVYSIPVALQPQTEREARKAPLCQIALKFSGAFHFSQVLVNIER